MVRDNYRQGRGEHEIMAERFYAHCHKCRIGTRKANTANCPDCGLYYCLSHVYSYVDGSNGAITRNQKSYCRECYYARFPTDAALHTPRFSVNYDPSDPLPDDYRIDRAKAKARQFYTVKADSRRVGEVMTLETRGGNQ
jgi:hypothetical protein